MRIWFLGHQASVGKDGVGKLSHYCHIHRQTFCHRFLSTNSSANNRVNEECFLCIVYHVSAFLILEKKEFKKMEIKSPTSTPGALWLPLYPAVSSIRSSFLCCYLNITLSSTAPAATDNNFKEKCDFNFHRIPLHCRFRSFTNTGFGW